MNNKWPGRLTGPKEAKSIMELTNCERKVLELMAAGLSSTEAAGRLYVSKRTIDFHMSNILPKLDAANRTQAVVRALRSGLIAFPDA